MTFSRNLWYNFMIEIPADSKYVLKAGILFIFIHSVSFLYI